MEFVDGKFVTSSSGIKLLSSDCRIQDNEVKGGFWYGLYIQSSHGVVSGNFFDQCRYGALITSGSLTRFVGNRFAHNRVAGVDVNGVSPSFVGNEFFHTNLSRQESTGTYDGVGLLLTDTAQAIIVGNQFTQQLDGIEYVDAWGCQAFGNTELDLDGILHNYASNISVTSPNIIQDQTTGDAIEYTGALVAQRTGNANGFAFAQTVKFNEAVGLGLNSLGDLAGAQTVDPGDGSYITANPSGGTLAITLSSLWNFTRYIGCIIVVQNVNGANTFTFEGVTVPVSTAYQFVVTTSAGAVVRIT